jgi:hypothetical protein
MASSAITIAPVEELSFKSSSTVFVSVFGLFWLFLEPLGLFGLLPSLSGFFAWATYLGLFFASLTVVIAVRLLYRRAGCSKLTFVTFTVASSADGADHFVRVPENMQVWHFVHEFLSYLSRGPARERIRQLMFHFDPALQISRDGNFVEVSNSLTLSQAGITNGVRCQIRGISRPERDEPLFSRRERSESSEP